ncbi:MAG: recombinase family protein, partial [Desulfitobacteriaceae bacterium]|nr:recombinase family protein [Desulfitobacteriaceae bacterium]
NYKRKAGGKNAVWQCSTYLEQGKAACYAKQIPETILLKTATEVLGLDDFDEKVFAENIAKIAVQKSNWLIFIFADGQEVETLWQDRSRAESWTDEMKQVARERQLKILEGRRE